MDMYLSCSKARMYFRIENNWLGRRLKVSILYLTYLVHFKCSFTLKLVSNALTNSEVTCLEQQVQGAGSLESQVWLLCFLGKGASWPISSEEPQKNEYTKGSKQIFFSLLNRNGSSIPKAGGKSQERRRKQS